MHNAGFPRKEASSNCLKHASQTSNSVRLFENKARNESEGDIYHLWLH
jgi:hypothetical protein